MRTEKNLFWCPFIVQNPIQTMLRFQIFQVFFPNINIFTVLTPYTAQVRKVKSAKNHFLVLFYSAKSISDHFTISELFQFFFKKLIFFTVSNPILQRWETWVQNKSFLVLFYSAKSNSDHVTIWSFFRKINFFYCFDPYTAQVRKVKSAENHFFVLFHSAKSISDPFTISEFFQVFFKNQFFHCFESKTAKVRNMRSEKNHF